MRLRELIAVPLIWGAMSGCSGKEKDVALEELRKFIPEICAVDSNHDRILSKSEIETWQRITLGLDKNTPFSEEHIEAMHKSLNKLRSFRESVRTGPNLNESINNFYSFLQVQESRLEKEMAERNKIETQKSAIKAETEFSEKLKKFK